MAEPVIYMRGFPRNLGDMAQISRRMSNDLEAIASIPEEQLEAICKGLMEAKGFLSPTPLLAAIREVIDDDCVAHSIQRMLRNLAPEDVPQLLENLTKPTKASKKDGGKLDEEKLAGLRLKLPKLIQPYPAISRLRKAERLASLTGESLDSIELICDLRPIFDESRTVVEGMMPYTRLRLVVTGADGLPKAFEAQLTHQQVQDLAKKADKALKKLTVLRQEVENWLPRGLPDLPLTQAASKEPNDV